MSEEFQTFDRIRPLSPTITPLDDEARAFLAEALEVATALGLPENIAELSALFQERREHWFAMDERDRPDPNDFVTAVSVVVGQRLAQVLGVDWVMYRDADGESLALLVEADRLEEGQDLYVFPIDGISSRWPQDGDDEVLAYYEGVSSYVREQLK
jgi:hypothetical protein